MRIFISIFFVSVLLFSACQTDSTPKTLPKLGNKEVVDGDTIFHQISDFSFVDQDSNVITNSTFANKVYVADIFFTSCPSICPKVKQQMLRLYDKFQNNKDFVLISHTIDVARDSVPRLNAYAKKLEVETDRWHFVTGEEEKLYDMADELFIAATKDPEALGGFDHSGRLILVDANRHVRSFAEGTNPEDVTRFMDDIQLLLDENKK